MSFRLERVTKLVNDIKGYIYSESKEINPWKIKAGTFRGEDLRPDISDWDDFKSGEEWGGFNYYCWFGSSITIPEQFKGRTVVLHINTANDGEWNALNPQFILYVNGELKQGLDVNHTRFILNDSAVGGQEYHIALHAYSGRHDRKSRLSASIEILDREVEKLYFDLSVPLQVAQNLDPENKYRIDILNYLNSAVNILDFRKPFSRLFYKSIEDASDFMENEFYGKYCGNSDVIASCVGHTHIDIAWLWTVSQAREKTARSFSTVLSMMEGYPEYIFMSSQPQLYEFVKQDYPELYERLKLKVREGKWEPEGAMWLEADCNLVSGESFVRQILFGTRFFMEEFGQECRILWLPDVFGYSAALPQILKKSGIKYFMTTKITWNQFNKFPYDTFTWKGIDGSTVLAHFATPRDGSLGPNENMTTYNANLIPSQVIGAWKRYQQKEINNNVLISFGYGDGGGGPTAEMLENARRMARGIPGCPKVNIEKAADFFDRLDSTVSCNPDIPQWVGELYFEYHRGTYTSMARNKKFNRKSEFLYQDIELFSIINRMNGARYPGNEINAGWKIILLNQFHDILPGSSIKEVYDDSRKQYLKVIQDGEALLKAALDEIAGDVALKQDSVIVFNQLSFIRDSVVKVALDDTADELFAVEYNGKIMNSQVIYENGIRKLLFFAEGVSPKGYKCFNVINGRIHEANGPAAERFEKISVEKDLLENRYFKIKLDECGNIVSFYDKENCREIIKPGEKGNVLQAYEDRPLANDAWDIDIFYKDKMWEVNETESVSVVECGPVRGCLRVRKRFVDSVLEQDIVIYAHIPRVDFVNRVDWKEQHILLKAAFPIDISAGTAIYEIQYGNIERPTHWNTSWDRARFEVCGHKWADLSEGGYGVSLLNDCKYGYDIKDSVMKLTLIKSASYPNEEADREYHEFTYSLYPHKNPWRQAQTVEQAYDLNCPMYVKIEKCHNGRLPAEFSLAGVNVKNVLIDCIKEAEDDEGIIIRLYEYKNILNTVDVTMYRNIKSVYECNLLEHMEEKLEPQGGSFSFMIKPYEIKTFKVFFT